MIEPNEYGSFGDCVISCDICTAKPCENIKQALDELREYKQAEKDGTIIRLPCKVGCELYFIGEVYNRIYNLNTEEILISAMPSGSISYEADGVEFGMADIGETVFLARKEAEAKIKELGNE